MWYSLVLFLVDDAGSYYYDYFSLILSTLHTSIYWVVDSVMLKFPCLALLAINTNKNSKEEKRILLTYGTSKLVWPFIFYANLSYSKFLSLE
jgi:hypothetical protein